LAGPYFVNKSGQLAFGNPTRRAPNALLLNSIRHGTASRV